MVGPVLKGAKPADLPVMRTTNVHLYIDLKTARTRLTVAPALLLLSRAKRASRRHH